MSNTGAIQKRKTSSPAAKRKTPSPTAISYTTLESFNHNDENGLKNAFNIRRTALLDELRALNHEPNPSTQKANAKHILGNIRQLHDALFRIDVDNVDGAWAIQYLHNALIPIEHKLLEIIYS